MTLHPQARAALDRMVEGNPPPIHTLSVEEARAAHMATMWMSAPGEPVANVEDLVAPGSGGDLRVRVYTPAGRGPWPILVYFHGGGWVVGNLETVDALCRTLASRTPCVVVSVDYPLAP
ncbi:MAG: alpha/beta hydrolase fold domain-containing protein, partial [Actinobacteria bacterium]|nr:alpha/beta hydrolase fold domain-containing protein [Actinomycetota bacterium]